ncbi:PREDICTED: uncharacterized protein LOC108363057 [Rhagoletis zephyria]|uniref:uncharacterized protein LOC108363057 n=1 Tax=Rhagoletis zephyria TaxID=28612 RepID=UPI0008113003|nr:PREDICTED: uncharacterized protein LOC108363057 [Rhagoletis zephyria]
MTRFAQMLKKTAQHAHRYPKACRLCNGRHPIRLCPVYRAKNPEERLREALLGKFCSNCLAMEHRTENCTSAERCRRCHDKHHTTLHLDPVDRRPWSQPVAEEEDELDVISIYAFESGTETRSFRPEPETLERIEPGAETRTLRPNSDRGAETRTFRPPLNHETQRLAESETRSFRSRRRTRRTRGAETRSFRPPQQPPQANQLRQQNGTVASYRQLRASGSFRNGLTDGIMHMQVLRPMISISPTAVIKIESGGRLHLIRALIDACTPSTLIARDLARDLGLQTTRVGNQRGCFLCLRGKHGVNKKVATHAKIINNTRRISTPKSVDPTIVSTYVHIRLADPNFFESSPIRIVLGADVYAEIIMPGSLPTSFGPLLAQSTIFGWVLSGAYRA